MGLLKHAIFPLLTLMYANNFVQFLVLQRGKEILENDGGWPATGESLTPWEERIMHMIGGGSLAMLFGSVVGLVTEHGHYRAIFATINLISFGADTYLSYQVGFPWKFSAGVSGALAIALIAHAFEPGFLTKDKSKTKKN